MVLHKLTINKKQNICIGVYWMTLVLLGERCQCVQMTQGRG